MNKFKIKQDLLNSFHSDDSLLSERLKYLNEAIFLCRINSLISNKNFLFLFSLIPTISYIFYSFFTADINTATFKGVLLLPIHFISYFLIKKYLLKDISTDFSSQESDYMIEVLKEIKNDLIK
jgi:hypothetical protein